MSEVAKLIVRGQEYEFPIVEGTENEVAIDIKSLRAVTGGIITLDSGFKNTGSCESKITFLDGEKGIWVGGGPLDGDPGQRVELGRIATRLRTSLDRAMLRSNRRGRDDH